jgi:hypothetical protein
VWGVRHHDIDHPRHYNSGAHDDHYPDSDPDHDHVDCNDHDAHGYYSHRPRQRWE